jgi:hypothetical protein
VYGTLLLVRQLDAILWQVAAFAPFPNRCCTFEKDQLPTTNLLHLQQ